ncbi:MAG: hypothetical protein ACK518_02575 [bacterium]
MKPIKRARNNESDEETDQDTEESILNETLLHHHLLANPLLPVRESTSERESEQKKANLNEEENQTIGDLETNETRYRNDSNSGSLVGDVSHDDHEKQKSKKLCATELHKKNRSNLHYSQSDYDSEELVHDVPERTETYISNSNDDANDSDSDSQKLVYDGSERTEIYVSNSNDDANDSDSDSQKLVHDVPERNFNESDLSDLNEDANDFESESQMLVHDVPNNEWIENSNDLSNLVENTSSKEMNSNDLSSRECCTNENVSNNVSVREMDSVALNLIEHFVESARLDRRLYRQISGLDRNSHETNSNDSMRIVRNENNHVNDASRQLSDHGVAINSSTRDNTESVPEDDETAIRGYLRLMREHAQEEGYMDLKFYLDALGFYFLFHNDHLREDEIVAAVNFLIDYLFHGADDEAAGFTLATSSDLHSDNEGSLFSIKRENSYVHPEYQMKEIMLTTLPFSLVISIDDVKEFLHYFQMCAPQVAFETDIAQKRVLFKRITRTAPRVALKCVLHSLRLCRNLTYLKIIRVGQNIEKDVEGLLKIHRKLKLFCNLNVERKYVLQFDIAAEFGFSQNETLRFPQYRLTNDFMDEYAKNRIRVERYATEVWTRKRQSNEEDINWSIEGGVTYCAKTSKEEFRKRTLPVIARFSKCRCYKKLYHRIRDYRGYIPSNKVGNPENYTVMRAKRFLNMFENVLKSLKNLSILDMFMKFRMEWSFRSKMSLCKMQYYMSKFSFKELIEDIARMFIQMEDQLGLEPIVNVEELPIADRVFEMVKLCISECRILVRGRNEHQVRTYLNEEQITYFRSLWTLIKLSLGFADERARSYCLEYFNPDFNSNVRRLFHDTYVNEMNGQSSESSSTEDLFDNFMLPKNANEITETLFPNEVSDLEAQEEGQLPSLDEINACSYNEPMFYELTARVLHFYFRDMPHVIDCLNQEGFDLHNQGQVVPVFELKRVMRMIGISIPHPNPRKPGLVQMIKSHLPRIIYEYHHRANADNASDNADNISNQIDVEDLIQNELDMDQLYNVMNEVIDNDERIDEHQALSQGSDNRSNSIVRNDMISTNNSIMELNENNIQESMQDDDNEDNENEEQEENGANENEEQEENADDENNEQVANEEIYLREEARIEMNRIMDLLFR